MSRTELDAMNRAPDADARASGPQQGRVASRKRSLSP